MSQYDLVIRSGSVIDGTGQQPFTADVAIKNGKIAATGRVSGHGDREVNADGALVTPGFLISIHTMMGRQHGRIVCLHLVTTELPPW